MLDLSNPRVLKTIDKIGAGIKADSEDRKILQKLAKCPNLTFEERTACSQIASGKENHRAIEVLALLRKRLLNR